MVARIAPSPINSAVAIGDALGHAPVNALAPVQPQLRQGNSGTSFERHETAQVVAPPPTTPPGEAFAAAVIAGQLPPRPMTPEQLRQRLGAAWQPPASPLRLMDRRV